MDAAAGDIVTSIPAQYDDSAAAVNRGDRTAPAVAVTSPAAGTTVSETVTLNVSASDKRGVVEVDYYVDGGLVEQDTSGPDWSQAWNSAGVADGSHSLVAKARDAAGNWGTSAAVSFAVHNAATASDTTAPSVSVTAPLAGATVSAVTALTAIASDAAGVMQVKWYVDGTEVAWDGNGAPWTQTWDSTRVADGTHQMVAKAADAAGNWGTSAAVAFAVRNASPPPPPPPPMTGANVVMAAADFTACQGSGCTSGNSKAVRDVIAAANPEIVLGLGDFQYENIDTISNGFDLLYGAKPNGLWPLFRTTAGPTHDVSSCTDTRYADYFGRPAMSGYSFDLGAWHIIQLPSASYRYGCGTASVLSWLKNDLASSTTRCTLAFWHEPYWTRPTSEHPTRTSAVRPWVQALYDANAELILSGHQHNYQRFAPQTPDDQLDPARGIRSFIVGTGGIGTYGFTGSAANLETSDATTYGALKLTLSDGSYDFQFVRAAGGTFTDSGTGTCH
ncbi:MAG: hypothetical protein H0V68_05835 [Actinobacteria bacterium]|nr:hypothetical protein [Actinomycetota bacterium]